MRPPVNKAGFRAGRDTAAVQENIELLTGQRGNGLDRAITVRELAQLGLIGVSRGSAGNVVTKPIPPTGGGGGDIPVQLPHAPSGFMAYGGFGSIMLEWQLPTFKGFAHAEVWRAAPNLDGSAPNLEQAVLVATTPATVFGDIVDPGSTFYYWCRFVNIRNTAGPYNAVDGTLVKTNSNISDIIDDIGNQMQDSDLIQGLVTGISEGDKAVNAALDDAKETFDNTIARVEREYKSADSTATAAIKSVENAVADANESIVELGTQIRTEFKDADKTINSTITSLSTTTSDKDAALAQDIKRIEAAYKAGDDSLSGQITALDKVTVDRDKVVSDKVDTVQSTINNVSATVQQNSTAISTINKDGSTAHKAMWSTKAQAGDIKAGIGILAKSDGTSQVAVAASQFVVFDPNSPGKLTPTFAIDRGNVVIPKALIESATIQILNAQHIVADSVVAGVSISSPTITGGFFGAGWAGFGVGGRHSGYHTAIYNNGHIATDNITAHGGSFTGTVNANAGTFNNVTINSNCNVHGTIYANRLEGDIAECGIGSKSVSVSNGNHRVVLTARLKSMGRSRLARFRKVDDGQKKGVYAGSVGYYVKLNGSRVGANDDSGYVTLGANRTHTFELVYTGITSSTNPYPTTLRLKYEVTSFINSATVSFS